MHYSHPCETGPRLFSQEKNYTLLIYLQIFLLFLKKKESETAAARILSSSPLFVICDVAHRNQ